SPPHLRAPALRTTLAKLHAARRPCLRPRDHSRQTCTFPADVSKRSDSSLTTASLLGKVSELQQVQHRDSPWRHTVCPRARFKMGRGCVRQRTDYLHPFRQDRAIRCRSAPTYSEARVLQDPPRLQAHKQACVDTHEYTDITRRHLAR